MAAAAEVSATAHMTSAAATMTAAPAAAVLRERTGRHDGRHGKSTEEQ
jgi:hypothetical protein